MSTETVAKFGKYHPGAWESTCGVGARSGSGVIGGKQIGFPVIAINRFCSRK